MAKGGTEERGEKRGEERGEARGEERGGEWQEVQIGD